MANPGIQELRSTFPLEAGEIARRKWSTALSSPVTWAPFLPAVGAYAFLDTPGSIVALAIGAITGGLIWYWKRQGDTIEKKIIDEMIRESNREQDTALNERARSFHQRGCAAYAVNFARFLKLKQAIETVVHSEGDELTDAKQQVEKLVDSLCFGVADEFERIIQLEQMAEKPLVPLRPGQVEEIEGERAELVERIHRAYKTLADTQLNLPVILNPVGKATARDSRLDDVINRLKEESEIARRVKERLSGSGEVTNDSMGETTYSASQAEKAPE